MGLHQSGQKAQLGDHLLSRRKFPQLFRNTSYKIQEYWGEILTKYIYAQ